MPNLLLEPSLEINPTPTLGYQVSKPLSESLRLVEVLKVQMLVRTLALVPRPRLGMLLLEMLLLGMLLGTLLEEMLLGMLLLEMLLLGMLLLGMLLLGMLLLKTPQSPTPPPSLPPPPPPLSLLSPDV